MRIKLFCKQHRNMIIAGFAGFILLAAIIILSFLTTMKNPAAGIADLNEISHDRGEFGADITVHDSAGGEILIHPLSNKEKTENEAAPLLNPMKTISDPETIWEDSYAYAGNFTLAEEARMKNDAIGVLSIPAIYLSANVYESTDAMEDMSKGIAHFPSTSAFEGNVGLSAHNVNLDGSNGLFKNLYLLNKGDTITYKTALGTKTYIVSSLSAIDENDWSSLSYADDNRLTLITCISGQKDKRLCVQAFENA